MGLSSPEHRCAQRSKLLLSATSEAAGRVAAIAFVGIALGRHRPWRTLRPHSRGCLPSAVAGTIISMAATVISGRIPRPIVMVPAVMMLVAAAGIGRRQGKDQADDGCGE